MFEGDCVGLWRCFGMDLKCGYMYVFEVKYCPVGDHFGFQVGFLKQYVV